MRLRWCEFLDFRIQAKAARSPFEVIFAGFGGVVGLMSAGPASAETGLAGSAAFAPMPVIEAPKPGMMNHALRALDYELGRHQTRCCPSSREAFRGIARAEAGALTMATAPARLLKDRKRGKILLWGSRCDAPGKDPNLTLVNVSACISIDKYNRDGRG